MLRLSAIGLALLLGACTSAAFPGMSPVAARHAGTGAAPAMAAPAAQATGVDSLIARYAALYNVPESLIRQVIARESGYNAAARHGPFYGLMQIRYDTAQAMGYRGPASGLLDADTNLRYGVKYLSGAYLVGGRNAARAIRNYSSGYYYEAKRRGLLDEVGL